jgi:pimeloyl-ACP methyl ester carboxylesterase
MIERPNVVRSSFFLVAGAIAATLQACAADAPARTPLDLRPCTAIGGADALCGQLAVPEDPSDPDGRMIDLAITVLPATGPDSLQALDPVFALHGGPGAAARYLAPVFANHPVRARRDIVLVDQRGTGGSNPMRCISGDAGTWLGSVLRFEFDPAACENFEADPRLYTTPVAMDDLDAVRAALGAERITLWGGSYGTRAALVYLRRHPERVRAAVLDGVAPLSLLVPAEFGRTSAAAFDLLAEDCAADAVCGGSRPIRDLLDETRARLTEAPAEVEVAYPGRREPVTISFGPTELGASILYALYNPVTAAAVPAALRAAHAGDYAPAAALGAAFAAGVAPSFSVGMTLSVLCAEDVPFDSSDEPRGADRTGFLGPDFAARLHETCAEWPAGTVAEGYRDPVTSDVPVLLLSGEADPVTPPEFAEAAAATLSNHRHVVFPDQGHGQTATPCGARLVTAFVEAGSVAGLDASCVTNSARPSFRW